MSLPQQRLPLPVPLVIGDGVRDSGKVTEQRACDPDDRSSSASDHVPHTQGHALDQPERVPRGRVDRAHCGFHREHDGELFAVVRQNGCPAVGD